MYDINFIGRRIVPESRKKVIGAIIGVTAFALGLTLVSVGSTTVADIKMTNVYAAESKKIQEQMTTNYPGIPSEGELETIIGRIEPHLKDIGKIVASRRSITPIWEGISLAVPDGVWLTSVCISDPRETEEEKAGRGRSFRGITITGVALAGGGPEGDRAVSAFVDNLKSNESLMDAVSDVEFLGTGLEQVGGTSVVGFEISCPF